MEINIDEKEEVKVIEASRQQLKTISRLVLADEIPQGQTIDMLFFNSRAVGDTTQPGRPGHDEGGFFEYINELFKDHRFKDIVLIGSDGQNWKKDSPIEDRYLKGDDKSKAWAGRSEYVRKLIEASDVDVKNIFFTKIEVGNMREENIAAADMLVQHPQWKSIALLCHPHQSLRNAAGQINENKKRGFNVKTYFVHPEKTNWEEHVYGSQSKDRMLREDHALPEMQRVSKYINENLAGLDEILNYLELRDGGLERLNTLLDKKMQNPHFRNDVEVVENAINSLTSDELKKLTNLQN